MQDFQQKHAKCKFSAIGVNALTIRKHCKNLAGVGGTAPSSTGSGRRLSADNFADDNMQGLEAHKNGSKSNSLPSVKDLAVCRNSWPVGWGDALPRAISCPTEYLHLRQARPTAEQKWYSALPRHEVFDEAWLASLCEYFDIIEG